MKTKNVRVTIIIVTNEFRRQSAGLNIHWNSVHGYDEGITLASAEKARERAK